MEAAALLDALRARGLKLATAESCTGGLIAANLTDIPGSSDVFERGFITYSNASKTELLEVDPALIATHGAVSEPVACAMAYGALTHSQADVSIAVTGIAGPGGGSEEKPVGLVFIAVAGQFGKPRCEEHHFAGSRARIREGAAQTALEMIYDYACKP